MAKTDGTNVAGSNGGKVIVVEAGQEIDLSISSLDGYQLTQDGNDLILSSADGETIRLEGFLSQALSPAPANLVVGGEVIEALAVIDLLENYDAAAVEPAAGPAGGATGGGAGFGAYGDDGIGEGLGIGDLLDPTELEFNLLADDEFVNPLAEAPDLLLNEIGLGNVDSTDLSERFGEDVSEAIQEFLNHGYNPTFTEGGGPGFDMNYIELRNATGSSQNTAGDPDIGFTDITIQGEDGQVSFTLPDVTIVSGGQLVLFQAVETDGGDPFTFYVLYDAAGNITGSGSAGPVGFWPVGEDTTHELGVVLTFDDSQGNISEVDTFFANGGFIPEGEWTPVPGITFFDTLGGTVFGDSATFNGQIATQSYVSERLLDAYGPISLETLVACSPIKTFGAYFRESGPAANKWIATEPNNIFARVDNADTDTAADWTTGLTDTIGEANNFTEGKSIGDPNPQDPYNDDMDPGQPDGPTPVLPGETEDNNGQNVIIVGENDPAFTEGDGTVFGGRAQDWKSVV